MRALRLLEWKSNPAIVEVETPTAEGDQVVVRIGGAGACHSDIHLMRDYNAGTLPWNPPFTLGHENAGWVHEVGISVRGFEVGQPVAVYGPWGCGRCDRCEIGAENYCDDPNSAPIPNGGGGLGLDGGMAEFMFVPSSRLLVALPDGLDPIQAAPMMDAGLTSYHAVRRAWAKLLSGSSALVIGVGGLGHLAVQILKLTTGARIIAVDVRPEALELALSCGADHAFCSGASVRDEILEVTRGKGVDVILDFVGTDETISLGASVGRALGDFSVVGIGGGSFRFTPRSLPHEMSIQHPYWGSRPSALNTPWTPIAKSRKVELRAAS